MALILDDHQLVREGLSSLIHKHNSEEEILHADTVSEAITFVENAEENKINMVLVEISLNKENGFDFLKWLREKKKYVKTLVITSSLRQSDFVNARELGVDAYILKDTLIEEIMYGLKVVERGGKFYSTALRKYSDNLAEDKKALGLLTKREMDVLALLSQGYSNAKISKVLFISEGTTKKHISSIFSKLNLHCRVEAVLLANNNSHNVWNPIDKSFKTNFL